MKEKFKEEVADMCSFCTAVEERGKWKEERAKAASTRNRDGHR